jgi:hypothetical protein
MMSRQPDMRTLLRRLGQTAVISALLFPSACQRPGGDSFTMGPAKQVALPRSAACDLPLQTVTQIKLDATALDGPVRDVVGGFSTSDPVVAVTAYGGVFVAKLGAAQGAQLTKLAVWGTEPGTVSRLSALGYTADGTWTLVDAMLRRRTTMTSDGRYVDHTMLRPPATVDAFGIDLRGVYATTSDATSIGYDRTRGVLVRLAGSGRFMPDSFSYATPARHASPDGIELALAQRPLERDPIVASSRNGVTVINSSDSLELAFVRSDGGVTRLAGNGNRIPITPHQIDSSSLEYGKRMLPKDPELPARHAREMLFSDRKFHQLIDAAVVLGDDRVAIRRTRACGDRDIWYVVRSSGELEGSFAVPLGLNPISAVGDTVFAFRKNDSGVSLASFQAREPIVVSK